VAARNGTFTRCLKQRLPPLTENKKIQGEVNPTNSKEWSRKDQVMQRASFRVCSFLFLLLSTGILASAQSDRATITGTVKDSAGAVLPGATVTVTNRDTGVVFTTPTNGDGVYSIPNLPVGSYTLEIQHGGFKTFTQTGILPLASQEVRADVTMTVGATNETVTVSAGAPAVESQNASESMTLETDAINELPLNANGGRNGLNLLLATAPNVSDGSGGVGNGGTQNWFAFAGGQTFSNSIFIDGTNASSAGNQGSAITPVQDGIQEMQLQTNVTDAELGQTGGGALVYALKSGTNKFHGSGFEFLQNEALNANQWLDNYYNVPRAFDSFNDYGGSFGGPILRSRTFFFADTEYFSQSNLTTNPTGITVPLTQMVTVNGSGSYDLSPLLTLGANTGNIPNPDTATSGSGTSWINPCTGEPYQYGQVFDPATQKTVTIDTKTGPVPVVCATPFANNQIPAARVGTISSNIAAAYAKYYPPSQNRLIGGNYPALGGTPSTWQLRTDVKIDHNFSDKHHISGSWNYENGLSQCCANFPSASGPFEAEFHNIGTDNMLRVIDNFSITPTLINTFTASWSRQWVQQAPTNNGVNVSSYGFKLTQPVFPLVNIGASTNGIGYTNLGANWDIFWANEAYNYGDNLQWQKGRHSIKFGWQWTAWQENAENFEKSRDEYDFATNAGGPTDSGVTPLVGSSFASMLLGTVQSAEIYPSNPYKPRQKYSALFAQDDYKVNQKLTLNLGVRWDLTLPIHWPNAAWENWDINTVNPNWAPYGGAWVFSPNSSSSFETYIPLYQFGPHLGLAYKLSNKLVARASYNLTYLPANAVGAGAADYYVGSQDPLNGVGCTNINTKSGSYAYQWDSAAPCTPTSPVATFGKSSSITEFGDASTNIMDVEPGVLKLGRVNTLYAGVEYELARNVVLDARYLGTYGRALQDYSQSRAANYTGDWNTYDALLESGNIYTTVNSAASAATVSASAGVAVPFPYATFNGSAGAAISPYPQLAQNGFALELPGNQSYLASSNYSSAVAELKVRNTHGLFVDWSYTLSSYRSNSSTDTWGVPTNFGNSWGTDYQSPNDSQMWPVGLDQRQLAKGYLTYDLPVGRGTPWLNSPSTVLNEIVGGWTVGYYGAYGSGLPMGRITSPYQLPYYFQGNQRAYFANGATATSIKNSFKRNFNPGTPTAASNNDFSPTIVHTDSEYYYNNNTFFGDTPLYFDKWRWNADPAQENISLLKHFTIGREERYKASIRGDFFNAFNRHYFNAPDENVYDGTFGDVTGISTTSRVVQVAARFEF